MSNVLFKISKLFFVFWIFLKTKVVFAQSTPYKVLTDIGDITTNTPTNAPEYIGNLYRTIIALSSVLAVLMIVIGGFMYLSSDAVSQKSAGKEKIRNALIGLLIVLTAFILLETINPKLVEFGFASAPVEFRGYPNYWKMLKDNIEDNEAFAQDIREAEQRIIDGDLQIGKTLEAIKPMLDAKDILDNTETIRGIFDGSITELNDERVKKLQRTTLAGLVVNNLDDLKNAILISQDAVDERELLGTLQSTESEIKSTFAGVLKIDDTLVEAELKKKQDFMIFDATINAATKDLDENIIALLGSAQTRLVTKVPISEIKSRIQMGATSVIINLNKIESLATRYPELGARALSFVRFIPSKYGGVVNDICNKLHPVVQRGVEQGSWSPTTTFSDTDNKNCKNDITPSIEQIKNKADSINTNLKQG